MAALEYVKKVKAAVLHDFNQDFVIEEVDQIAPRGNEIRVKVVSCGICHTENAYRTKLWNTPLKMPIVLGHEGAGIVDAVGPGVTKFKVGDKVCMTTPYCGYCDNCKNGRTWYCKDTVPLQIGGFDYYGTTPIALNGQPVHTMFNQSALEEYTVLHINNCVKLPDDFDLKIAGPLGCGLRTGAGTVYNCLKPRVCEWVAIFGTGAVGLAAMWMAKAMGAKTIMVDYNNKRLEEALEFGADKVVCTKDMTTSEEIADAVKKCAGDEVIPHVLEGTGNPMVHKAAMMSLTFGGHCAQVSNINAMQFNSYTKDCNDGKEITFVRMGNVDGNIIIPLMADLYKRGMFPFDKLLTFYKFEDVNQALADHHAGKVFKPVILFD